MGLHDRGRTHGDPRSSSSELYHGLVLDLQGRRRCSALTCLSTDCTLGPPPQVFSVSAAKPYTVVKGSVGHTYDQLITRITHANAEPGLMASLPGLPIHHRIITTGQTVFSAPATWPESASQQPNGSSKTFSKGVSFDPLAASGASPLHMVAKPSGGWRVIGGFHQLNSQTQPDRHSHPIIEDLLQEVHGKVFSFIYYQKAYLQIPMAAEDIEKTAVTTPFGLCEFLGMPSGLKNGSKSLQRVKNHVYRKFSFVRSYQDDDLVFSETHEEHLEHL